MTTLQLHDYQIVARDFLRGVNRAGLFLDMGLGKTATCLSALEPRHLPALVVAPKKVAEETWDAERDLWRPDLSISLAVGEAARRRESLLSEADITVISRDNVDGDLAQLSRERKHPRYSTVIIDELSGYKNSETGRFRHMRDRCRRSSVKHVWGLTGTPSPNGYLDLWAPIFLLDDGARLGKRIGGYRSRYFDPGLRVTGGTVVSWDLKPDADLAIRRKIEDICLSMQAEGRIKIPTVHKKVFQVQLPPPVLESYDQFKEDLVIDLEEIFGGEVHSANNAASLTSKLSQITAGFMFVDDADIRDMEYTFMHDCNTKAVRKIVDKATGPCLVAYRFVPQKEMLLREFPEASTIDEKDVVKRWNRGEIPVLIVHPQSAGHGLNLQHGGHDVVWASLPWSLEEWEQTNGRLARQGQTEEVNIHMVLAPGTIDYLIKRRVEDKAEVQDELMDFLESPI